MSEQHGNNVTQRRHLLSVVRTGTQVRVSTDSVVLCVLCSLSVILFNGSKCPKWGTLDNGRKL